MILKKIVNTYGDRAKLFISRAKKWEDTEMVIVLKERRVNKGRLSMSLPCIVSTDKEILDKCTTFDLGKGGMSIFSNKSLEVGHVIELQCKDIWVNPKTGTVKWHQKIKHNLYRIGISFS